jgi:hypothetical protein
MTPTLLGHDPIPAGYSCWRWRGTKREAVRAATGGTLPRTEYQKEYYMRNKARIKGLQALPENKQRKAEYYANWNLVNKKRVMVTAAKNRARVNSWDFDLKAEDLEIPEYCPILGIPILIVKGPKRDGSPSLDRLDSSRGYTGDNVWIISWKANRIKSNATLYELIKIGEWAKNVPNANR